MSAIQPSCRRLSFLIFLVHFLEGTAGFSIFPPSISFIKQAPQLTRVNNNVRSRRTRIGLGVDPNVVVEQSHQLHSGSHQIQLTHDTVDVIGVNTVVSDISGGSSLLMAKLPFFGSGPDYPIGQSIAPTNVQGMTAAISPESGVNVAAQAATDRQLTILETTDDNLLQPIYDNRAVEFYTREASVFAKLPLAAIIYVLFEFFFMNQKRQQDMYYMEEYGLDDVEEDGRAQLVEFGQMMLLRIGAAFLITFLTIVVSS